MLLEFRVRNYKSIRDLETFTMLPSRASDISDINLLKQGRVLALPTAALFGRNGAGKSNLLDAINELQEMVIRGENLDEDKNPHYKPYRLNPSFRSEPTYFGIEFIADDKIKYVYEIEFNAKEIILESLSFYPKGQKAKFFERTLNGISFGDSFTGAKASIEKLLYSNQLLLSKVKGDNIEALRIPFDFFREKIFCRRPSRLSNNGYLSHFAQNIYLSKYPNYRENIARLMRAADTGIVDLTAKKRTIESIKLPDEIGSDIRKMIESQLEYYIVTQRKSEIEGDDKIVNFNILDESLGTRRLLEVGGLILEALHDGQILIIDEFDLSLHPLLTKTLVKLFNSPRTNPNNAQLIVSTQDISLFDVEVFTYDQLWIVEKDFGGSSNYYSLSDIKGLRKNIPIQKWYTDGRLGGMPVINYLELEFDI